MARQHQERERGGAFYRHYGEEERYALHMFIVDIAMPEAV